MDANLTAATKWLQKYKLDEAQATPALGRRLVVRWKAQVVSSIMFAALFVAAGLVQAGEKLIGVTLLPLLGVVVVGMVGVQFLLDRWVRRVDREVGATLTRRAAHPVQPGWREVVGRSYAILGLAGFAGAAALVVSAFTVPDIRYPALVLLIGVAGVAAVAAVQIRHLLVRPVVAEDESSLTADVIMRIEDARNGTVPSMLWSLPVVLLTGFAPGWWAAAAFGFLFAGVIGLVIVTVKAPRVGTMARQVVGVQ